MTNRKENAGTEPAGKQAALDRRIADFEQALKSLDVDQTRRFNELEKAREEESKQISELGKAIKADAEARERADKEAQKTAEANAQDLKSMGEAQAEMAKAIAKLADAQEKDHSSAAIRDQVIEQLVNAYQSSQKRQADAEQQSAKHTEALVAMHGFLQLLIQDTNAGYTSLSDAVSGGLSELAGVVKSQTSTIQMLEKGVEGVVTGIRGVDEKLVVVAEDGRKTRQSVALVGRNVSRILRVVTLIQQEVEGLNAFMVATASALDAVAKTDWVFDLNKSMRIDLAKEIRGEIKSSKSEILKEINDLPVALRRSTAEILKSANYIKVEAQNFAAANASSLTQLQGEVQSLITYFSGEGAGVIKLLRDHTTSFETGIRTALGQAELNADNRMALVFDETQRRVDRLVKTLNEGDFGSLMSSLAATHGNVLRNMEQMDKAFQELKDFEDNSKAVIQEQVELVRTGVLSLSGEVHNMRQDTAGTATSVSKTREYLNDLCEDTKRYRGSIEDIQSAVQKILSSDAQGRHEFFNVLLEKLGDLVGENVYTRVKPLFEETALSLVINDQTSNNEE
ncbi:cell envelope integrity protein TolA [Pseudomonas juntendi]|uniref:cell envelope integrity protein TolA n=1 Tax=Pseudomonas TaxID=286 RepID=UPI0012AD8E41|nr:MULTISPECIES: cell envelope integrity protein TolA [Pseudomonas]MDG9918198.1 cell envelope integrity protein TolA [Pseudomonas juntendi]MDH0507646.1 cell envelope integrity protein TolA [Pseudomonas juntendi]MDH1044872.1 cell envelope integrity protein TolA [Pseudomonas juntendi]MRT62315.1 cell envelope integrity protein TolA [Pseudomonas sp. CAH-1]